MIEKEAKAKPILFWGLRAAAFYERCEGEVVTVHLVNGEDLAGEIVGVDQYDVVLNPGDGRRLLIPKHAVAYVALDGAAAGPGAG
jgi:RNA chaperone Hfq